MTGRNWRVFWGHDGIRQGEVTDFNSFECVLRAGDVGSFTIDMAWGQIPYANLRYDLTFDFVCYDRDTLNGDVAMTGVALRHTIKADEVGRHVTVSGGDQSVWLQRRLVVPPGQTFGTALSSPSAYVTATQTAVGYFLTSLLRNQAGSSAYSSTVYGSRAVPNLTIPVSPEYPGPALDGYKTRYVTLLQVFQDVTADIDVAWTIKANAVRIFQQTQRNVLFSSKVRNAASLQEDVSYPLGDTMYAGDVNNAENRSFYAARALYGGGPQTAGSPPGQWTELFADMSAQGTDGEPIQNQLYALARMNGVSKRAYTFELVPHPGSQFLVDWDLWDLVYVDLSAINDTTTKYTAPVQEVRVKVDAEGAAITPTVGDPKAILNPTRRNLLQSFDTRLKRIEVR